MNCGVRDSVCNVQWSVQRQRADNVLYSLVRCPTRSSFLNFPAAMHELARMHNDAGPTRPRYKARLFPTIPTLSSTASRQGIASHLLSSSLASRDASIIWILLGCLLHPSICEGDGSTRPTRIAFLSVVWRWDNGARRDRLRYRVPQLMPPTPIPISLSRLVTQTLEDPRS